VRTQARPVRSWLTLNVRSDVRIERATCGRARPKLCVCGPGAGQSTFSNIPTFDPVMPVPRPNPQLALDLELVSALFIPARFSPPGRLTSAFGRLASCFWRSMRRSPLLSLLSCAIDGGTVYKSIQ
jgi:hypothetical protein